ncbi:Double-strand break repair protein MRE11 [Morus notabilis]|uniref:Double-strand break repair protein MRE11 n=1 Tax=Morus notabilis TaxID=981085 RepID=W9RRV4_9ROSA|nr:Double-strand break repair protein MRE11 [Morus notabilis]
MLGRGAVGGNRWKQGREVEIWEITVPRGPRRSGFSSPPSSHRFLPGSVESARPSGTAPLPAAPLAPSLSRPASHSLVVLKDEPDINPNDQNSILVHLDKVVGNLIEKSRKKYVDKSELKLPLIRIKVDYSGFMTINAQRFGQKYVGKVANPQDILIFSKASKKGQTAGKINDSERLRPEELNQQNIEALVAENNLKMEILPVNDLDVALHNFVNKDDKMAFFSCIQYNLQETRNRIAKDDTLKFEEEDLILKERVKERSTRSKDSEQLSSAFQYSEDFRSNSSAGVRSAVSFSDDEDATQMPGLKSTARGRKGSSGPSAAASEIGKGKTTARGRGRGRGSGRGSAAGTLKQTTLDAALGFRPSQRSASIAATAAVQSIADDKADVDSASSEDAGKFEVDEIDDSSENDESVKGKGRKRAAPRGRSRGSTQSSKRGRASDNPAVHQMLMSRDDDDDDDDDDAAKKRNKPQPRVTRNYGALRSVSSFESLELSMHKPCNSRAVRTWKQRKL